MSDADLLTLTQWLSPAFPLGAFAWSHGLEQAVAAGEVTSAQALGDWLTDILSLGAGRSDAALLSLTLRGEDAGEMADLARALAPSRERWEETAQQGAAFAATLQALGHEVAPAALPVAVGQAARALELAPPRVAALYLHSFASNLVSAGVRFIPLGQSAGQGALARLHPLIEEIAQWSQTASASDITSFVPRADLGAMAHETLEVRIFKS